MVGKNCCIPGCTWSCYKAKTTGTVRHFFKLKRPDLAKNEEEKAHFLNLRKIVLSLRDPTKGDKIKKQLHKERYIFSLKFLSLAGLVDVKEKQQRNEIMVGYPHASDTAHCTLSIYLFINDVKC